MDSIHVEPHRRNKYRNLIPGRFDTALINVENGAETGVKGTLYGLIYLLQYCTETIFLDIVWVKFGACLSYPRKPALAGLLRNFLIITLPT